MYAEIEAIGCCVYAGLEIITQRMVFVTYYKLIKLFISAI